MDRILPFDNGKKVQLVAPDQGKNAKKEPAWNLIVTAPFQGTGTVSPHLADFDATINEDTLVKKALEIIQRLIGLSAHERQNVEIEVIRHLFRDYQSSLRKVGTFSAFPFFNGDRFVVLIAPDDPNLANRGEYWYIDTRTGTDTSGDDPLSVRYAGENISEESLISIVFEALYQGISSNETDKRRPEIEPWVREVRQAYHARTRATTPA